MLVKFESNVAGEMLMFADVARRLLQVTGEDQRRGVILAEQMPEIVSRLRQAVATDKPPCRRRRGRERQRRQPGQTCSAVHRIPRADGQEKAGSILWSAARDFGE